MPTFSLMLAVIASIFGVTLMTVMLMQPVNYNTDFTFTPILIGSLYIGICVLGIFAVFYPKKCQRTYIFQKSINTSGDQPNTRKTPSFIGHHPDCSNFSANRIRIRKSVQCAACSGLLIGALFAVVGSSLYFFAAHNLFWLNPWILVASNAGLVLGLFQFKFGGFMKLTVNILFVVCSFVTLVMVDVLGKSLFIDLYVLGLIIFFLTTRILLSEFYNKNKCNRCRQCF